MEFVRNTTIKYLKLDSQKLNDSDDHLRVLTICYESYNTLPIRFVGVGIGVSITLGKGTYYTRCNSHIHEIDKRYRDD